MLLPSLQGHTGHSFLCPVHGLVPSAPDHCPPAVSVAAVSVAAAWFQGNVAGASTLNQGRLLTRHTSVPVSRARERRKTLGGPSPSLLSMLAKSSDISLPLRFCHLGLRLVTSSVTPHIVAVRVLALSEHMPTVSLLGHDPGFQGLSSLISRSCLASVASDTRVGLTGLAVATVLGLPALLVPHDALRVRWASPRLTGKPRASVVAMSAPARRSQASGILEH